MQALTPDERDPYEEMSNLDKLKLQSSSATTTSSSSSSSSSSTRKEVKVNKVSKGEAKSEVRLLEIEPLCCACTAVHCFFSPCIVGFFIALHCEHSPFSKFFFQIFFSKIFSNFFYCTALRALTILQIPAVHRAPWSMIRQ